MKQLTYRAEVGGEELVVRFHRGVFQTHDPRDCMLDDPPRCAGSAGAHAWYAVVLAWHHRADRSVRWSREVVRDVVADARSRWTAGAEQQHRETVHELQAIARRDAEEHYPPAARPAEGRDLPPALRGAVLRPPTRRAR